jgi:hypothetical protein
MSIGSLKGTSYYKQSNGSKFDRDALKSAKRALSGERDGRISKKDASQIASRLNDHGGLTPTEKKTAAKVRRQNMTDAGRAQLKHELLSAAALRRELVRREARLLD